MKTFLAVDGNSILNRAFYGIRPLTTREGLHTNAVYGFVNILKRNIEAVNPDGLAVAFDLRAPTFRHEKFDGYKATRKGMPEELAMQLPYAKKCAEAMGASLVFSCPPTSMSTPFFVGSCFSPRRNRPMKRVCIRLAISRRGPEIRPR